MNRKPRLGIKPVKPVEERRFVRVKQGMCKLLVNARKRSGLTQPKAARTIGISTRGLGWIERDEGRIQVETASKYWKFFRKLQLRILRTLPPRTREVDPLTHIKVFEDLFEFEEMFRVAMYEVFLEVEPLDGDQKFSFPIGYAIPPQRMPKHPIKTDNKARVTKTVKFDGQNTRRSDLFSLSYHTRNGGLIRVLNNNEVSDPAINDFLMRRPRNPRLSPRWRFDESGDDVVFKFKPNNPAQNTYCLDLEVYKGFDKNERNLTCYLPDDTEYRCIKLKVGIIPSTLPNTI